MKKKKSQETKIRKTMMERYKHINKFRYSIFSICNRAIPTELSLNPIMAEIVLDKLREIKEEIREDISSITIDSIKADDIFGSRELELSKLLANEICWYDFSTYKSKYDDYLKGEALERILPTHKREKMIEEYNGEIIALEETVNALEVIDKQLVKEERRNLEGLKMKKQQFESKFNFPTLEGIEVSLFFRINSYLNNILEDVENKITYLEGNI